MTEDRHVEAVGQRMFVDGWTARTTTALRAEGVEPILLKGPAVADWLWPDGRAARTYADADLLVAGDDVERSRTVLVSEGFARVGAPLEVPVDRRRRHAETWFRERDHAAVDLHVTLHGLEHLDPAVVQRHIAAGATPIRVGRLAMTAPAIDLRALHLVLHIQPKDRPGTKAWSDLERAIEVVDRSTWVDAAALAEGWGVADAMGALLRLVPSGGPLADDLGLPEAPPPWLVQHHRRHALPAARAGHRLRSARPREVPAVLARLAVPPTRAMVVSYPEARRGRLGLAVAHLHRWVRLPGHALRAARQRTRRSGPTLR